MELEMILGRGSANISRLRRPASALVKNLRQLIREIRVTLLRFLFTLQHFSAASFRVRARKKTPGEGTGPTNAVLAAGKSPPETPGEGTGPTNVKFLSSLVALLFKNLGCEADVRFCVHARLNVGRS
jgi:hypothetical protein